jgi:hypothetical protein
MGSGRVMPSASWPFLYKPFPFSRSTLASGASLLLAMAPGKCQEGGIEKAFCKIIEAVWEPFLSPLVRGLDLEKHASIRQLRGQHPSTIKVFDFSSAISESRGPETLNVQSLNGWPLHFSP